jgi:hypothetical protein
MSFFPKTLFHCEGLRLIAPTAVLAVVPSPPTYLRAAAQLPSRASGAAVGGGRDYRLVRASRTQGCCALALNPLQCGGAGSLLVEKHVGARDSSAWGHRQVDCGSNLLTGRLQRLRM